MKTCLVVDDSKVIRMVARKILEELNFSVVEAEDGRKALDACKVSMPEGVLLDTARFFRAGQSGAGASCLSPAGVAEYHARASRSAPPELLTWLHRG